MRDASYYENRDEVNANRQATREFNRKLKYRLAEEHYDLMQAEIEAKTEAEREAARERTRRWREANIERARAASRERSAARYKAKRDEILAKAKAKRLADAVAKMELQRRIRQVAMGELDIFS